MAQEGTRQGFWNGRGRGHGRGHGHGRGRGRAFDGCPECMLDALRPGEQVDIVTIGDESARMQSLRFGMAEGARATCVTRIPAGPIVMRSGRQEIAVGRRLARRIQVRRVNASGTVG